MNTFLYEAALGRSWYYGALYFTICKLIVTICQLLFLPGGL
jgi:hypothetical protein